MTDSELIHQITEILGRIAGNKGATLPSVDATTQLLGGGLPLDSLDLALLVVEMEEATGFDPFASGFVNFRTVGELAQLYQR